MVQIRPRSIQTQVPPARSGGEVSGGMWRIWPWRSQRNGGFSLSQGGTPLSLDGLWGNIPIQNGWWKSGYHHDYGIPQIIWLLSRKMSMKWRSVYWSSKDMLGKNPRSGDPWSRFSLEEASSLAVSAPQKWCMWFAIRDSGLDDHPEMTSIAGDCEMFLPKKKRPVQSEVPHGMSQGPVWCGEIHPVARNPSLAASGAVEVAEVLCPGPKDPSPNDGAKERWFTKSVGDYSPLFNHYLTV